MEQGKQMPLAQACRSMLVQMHSRGKNINLAALSADLRSRIYRMQDAAELRCAFEEMYEFGECSNDDMAQNVAQWIGRRLYEVDSRLVTIRETQGAMRYYVPVSRCK